MKNMWKYILIGIGVVIILKNGYNVIKLSE